VIVRLAPVRESVIGIDLNGDGSVTDGAVPVYINLSRENVLGTTEVNSAVSTQ
jgi:hypothetical protein